MQVRRRVLYMHVGRGVRAWNKGENASNNGSNASTV